MEKEKTKETLKSENFFSRKNILVNSLFSLPLLILLAVVFDHYGFQSLIGVFLGIFIVLVGLLRKYYGNKITIIGIIALSVILYFTIINFESVVNNEDSVKNDEAISAESKIESIYKEPFVNECTKSGSSEIFCNCVFLGLKERIGLKKFGEIAISYKEKGENTPEWIEYKEIVKDEMLKCY